MRERVLVFCRYQLSFDERALKIRTFGKSFRKVAVTVFTCGKILLKASKLALTEAVGELLVSSEVLVLLGGVINHG